MPATDSKVLTDRRRPGVVPGNTLSCSGYKGMHPPPVIEWVPELHPSTIAGCACPAIREHVAERFQPGVWPCALNGSTRIAEWDLIMHCLSRAAANKNAGWADSTVLIILEVPISCNDSRLHGKLIPVQLGPCESYLPCCAVILATHGLFSLHLRQESSRLGVQLLLFLKVILALNFLLHHDMGRASSRVTSKLGCCSQHLSEAWPGCWLSHGFARGLLELARLFMSGGTVCFSL